MHSKRACWTPVTNINLCNKQRANTSSGDMLNQGETVFSAFNSRTREYSFLEMSKKYHRLL